MAFQFEPIIFLPQKLTISDHAVRLIIVLITSKGSFVVAKCLSATKDTVYWPGLSWMMSLDVVLDVTKPFHSTKKVE